MAAEKRLAYDAEFKLKAIDYAKEQLENSALMNAWYADGDSRKKNFILQESQRRVSVAVKQDGRGWKKDFTTGFLSKGQVAEAYLLSPFGYKPKQLQINCI
ncbi:hypothetical protein TURU_099622 [Turdus rufiventris]|nr:hypothetical protein TURU_099622 [Turdus rufiventris]